MRNTYMFLRAASYPIAFIAGVLLTWEALCRLLQLPVYVLPAPSHILDAVSLHRALLGQATLMTAAEALAGFLVALALGSVIAVLLVEFEVFRRAVLPYLTIAQAIPLIAIVPLILIWFGTGISGRIFMASLVSLFPVTIGLYSGLRSTDDDAEMLFDLYRAAKSERYKFLRIPASLPHFFIGVKSGLSLALVGALVAEFLIPVAGLGRILVNAAYSLNTPLLFGAVVATVALAVSFVGVATLLDRQLAFWHTTNRR